MLKKIISSRKIRRNRVTIIAIYVFLAVLVCVLFVRLPHAQIILKTTSDDICFTLNGDLNVDWPEEYSNCHFFPTFAASDSEHWGQALNVRSSTFDQGSWLQIGLSQQFTTDSIVFFGFSPNKSEARVFGRSLTVDRGSNYFVFFGTPILSGRSNNLVPNEFISVKNLNVSTLYGAALAVNNREDPKHRWTSKELDEVHREARVHSASLTFPHLGDLEKSLHEEDVIWLKSDVGQIRKLVISDDGVSIIYSAEVSCILAKSGTNTISLMPTYFDWIQAQSIFSKGVGLVIMVGGLVVATLRWWPKAKMDDT